MTLVLNYGCYSKVVYSRRNPGWKMIVAISSNHQVDCILCFSLESGLVIFDPREDDLAHDA